ncbi:uncharacterized protein LOC131007150 [Salvia miltiorrhiza]|uniref:uncharacterized protein LOC131007150 n=1 Tax=Salvia miltiorrhiza TaxID=226208 RepID=UPI0025AD6191|nr:uncharacterized protein LOC131007150 [Salvia miltiorrhiza]
MIFAGYNKAIRIFEVHRPGRDFEQHSTVLGNKEGQSGIISSIAFSPTSSGMLAVGSYNQTTAIYREDNMELLYVLHGQEGGVTQVQFSKDGNYLYSGGRKDPYILCWDIRKTVDIVYKLYRSSESTNQRIQFAIEPLGRYLGTGGQDGLVHIYDLQTGEWVSSFQAALGSLILLFIPVCLIRKIIFLRFLVGEGAHMWVKSKGIATDGTIEDADEWLVNFERAQAEIAKIRELDDDEDENTDTSAENFGD